MKLGDIATITRGQAFRSSLKDTASGHLRVIRMKDLSGQQVCLDQAVRIDEHPFKSVHPVKAGDLIFRSYGQNSTAALLSEDAPDTIIAAPLMRIRPQQERVLPGYLLWWINHHPAARAYLSLRTAGTSMPVIGRRTMLEMDIRLPSLDRQREIARVLQLLDRERKLMKKLADRKAQHVHGVLRQFALRGDNHQVQGD